MNFLKRVSELHRTGKDYLPNPEADRGVYNDPHELCHGIGANIGRFPEELIGMPETRLTKHNEVRSYY
jgi:hypothetical protein